MEYTETEISTETLVETQENIKESDDYGIFIPILLAVVLIVLLLGGTIGGSGGFYDPDRMY